MVEELVAELGTSAGQPPPGFEAAPETHDGAVAHDPQAEEAQDPVQSYGSTWKSEEAAEEQEQSWSSWKQEGAAEDQQHSWSSWQQDDSWGESSWKQEETWKEEGDGQTDAWKQEEVVEAASSKPSLVELNSQSDNNDLENGGIRVDDLFSFEYMFLSRAVGAASGAWVEANDIPSKSGGCRPGKIFTISEDAGSSEQRQAVQKYAQLAMAAKKGWIAAERASVDDPDLSIIAVPEDARDSLVGPSGLPLVELSEQKSVCVFAINDGNSAPPVVEMKPPEPWLALESKVEVLSKGDVRFTKWIPGTVSKIVSHTMVSVKPDRGGAPLLVEYRGHASLRPHFAEAEAVEAYTESDWVAASFVAWSDNNVKVKLEDETEVDLAADYVRKPAAPEQESSTEATLPKVPIRLAIFGTQRCRIEATLSILATAECLSPGFFETHPPPLPPALGSDVPAQDDETWVTATLEIPGKPDAARKNLDRIQKASGQKALVEVGGSTARIIGPPVACRLISQLVRLSAVAERSQVRSEEAPQGIEIFMEKVPMPGDLAPFISGKQRNRLNEIEDEDEVVIFFMSYPEPEKTDPMPEQTAPEQGEAPASPDDFSDHISQSVADFLKPEGGYEAASKPEDKPEEEKPEEESGEIKAEEDPEKPKMDILIFSIDARSRVRARLKLARAVESKEPGYVLGSDPEACMCSEQGAGTDIIDFAEDVAWLSGKQGKTKKKIAAASDCCIEFINQFGYLAGTSAERARAKQYFEWFLLKKPDNQKDLVMSAGELDARDDVTIALLSTEEKNSITKELGDIEEETRTFMMFNHKPDVEYFVPGEVITWTRGERTFYVEIKDSPAGEELSFSCKLLSENPWVDEEAGSKVQLLIFGADANCRAAAEAKVREVLEQKNAPAWGEEAADDTWGKNDEWSGGDEKWGTTNSSGDGQWGNKDTAGDAQWGKKDTASDGRWSKKDSWSNNANSWSEEATSWDNKWDKQEDDKWKDSGSKWSSGGW
eukprot:TRINITY_DN4653_c0_g1_i1.p1 TRINITY_DN4653_c0_g1~~TRINITY_DN4653_c0_g1_i1.p1  ORF type:complete len:1007 (+),score=294.37 TRINITY_DN4653_c0_g1_i1:26-3022(+)